VARRKIDPVIKAVAISGILVLAVPALQANPIFEPRPPPPPRAEVPPLILIALAPLAIETLVVAAAATAVSGFLFARIYLVWLIVTVLTWLPSSMLLRGVAISGPRWATIALYEIAVCLVEAAILFLLARAAFLRPFSHAKEMRPGMALAISCAGNLASLAAGFLILGFLNGLHGPSAVP
jgi:hypothetical protein